jgi:hypothetical protein
MTLMEDDHYGRSKKDAKKINFEVMMQGQKNIEQILEISS